MNAYRELAFENVCEISHNPFQASHFAPRNICVQILKISDLYIDSQSQLATEHMYALNSSTAYLYRDTKFIYLLKSSTFKSQLYIYLMCILYYDSFKVYIH